MFLAPHHVGHNGSSEASGPLLFSGFFNSFNNADFEAMLCTQVARGDTSPPWREVDHDGHFVFYFGENLTRRCTFERVLECWDRETREYVAIKVVRSTRKYRDAAMIEIDVLNRLAENEKYRSLSFVLYPSSDCFFCSTTNMLNMIGRGLEVKPGPMSSYFVSLTSFLLLASYTMDLDSKDEEKELNIPVIKENGKGDGKEDQRSEEKEFAAASKSNLGLEKSKDEYESDDSDEGE
ncbi:Serine/threonine-protein kinase AFC3 [Zea mays]|uniref:Serine/threonine-protein kinase AFC3 n=1 Tax=Zea mays TaxID=4577 RepID=A0A317Y922_MAIZE|nr:Serine/threonine-protein kinase AFC3 [Zea mays]